MIVVIGEVIEINLKKILVERVLVVKKSNLFIYCFFLLYFIFY